MNKIAILSGLGSVLVFSGCALNDKNDVTQYDSISEPASVYCVEQQGELQAYTEADRRVKYCVFSDDEKYPLIPYYNDRHSKD